MVAAYEEYHGVRAKVSKADRKTLCIDMANTTRMPKPFDSRSEARAPTTSRQNSAPVRRKLACSM